MDIRNSNSYRYLANQLQSRAEEFIEVRSRGFVPFDSGFDSFERRRALVADIH